MTHRRKMTFDHAIAWLHQQGVYATVKDTDTDTLIVYDEAVDAGGITVLVGSVVIFCAHSRWVLDLLYVPGPSLRVYETLFDACEGARQHIEQQREWKAQKQKARK